MGSQAVTSNKKRRKSYSAGHIIWLIVEYASLIFFGICAVLPIVSCVITAFKTNEEYANTNVMTLPQSWLNLDNFVKAFQTADMGRAFLNSLLVMVIVLFVSVIVGTQMAFVLNRFQFPGNALIRNLFLFASLLPGVAMQVTVYQIMTNLHLVNSLYLKGCWCLQRVLCSQPLPSEKRAAHNRNFTVYIRRTNGKPVQPHLCRCHHFLTSSADRIYLLPETDLQWNHIRSCKRLIL